MLSLVVACEPTPQQPSHRQTAELFVEVQDDVGVTYTHFNGMTGELYFAEMMGPGVALFDYDNDGDLDLYIGQGHLLGDSKQLQDAIIPPVTAPPFRDRLYRNDLTQLPDGQRQLSFTDVTLESGLNAEGYSMGVATGDIDKDGWTDLYITNFGANQMWRNQGDGTFREITLESGTGDERWSTSAVFFDYDRDGWLDLFVTNYVDFSVTSPKRCSNALGAADYCGPTSYEPLKDRLFHNLGDGQFEDVTDRAGLVAAGAGLGVVHDDFDGNGYLDLYVANDFDHNRLWLNQGNGQFVEDALMRGSAVNNQGNPEASMGVAIGDVDNDGDNDLFMTHLLSETNTLYINDGLGYFSDQSNASGLAGPSIGFTGFGTALFDFDNDSWLDLIAVNGEVRLIAAQKNDNEPLPLNQPNQLFHNDQGTFKDISEQVAPLSLPLTSRACAIGDIDNDGDSDVVITNNAGPIQILSNQVGNQNRWLGLRLIDASGRDQLGANVTLFDLAGQPLVRRVRTDGSYLSANDPRLLFGLARRDAIGDVHVAWPNGQLERWRGLGVDQYHTLTRGSGEALTAVANDNQN